MRNGCNALCISLSLRHIYMCIYMYIYIYILTIIYQFRIDLPFMQMLGSQK